MHFFFKTMVHSNYNNRGFSAQIKGTTGYYHSACCRNNNTKSCWVQSSTGQKCWSRSKTYLALSLSKTYFIGKPGKQIPKIPLKLVGGTTIHTLCNMYYRLSLFPLSPPTFSANWGWCKWWWVIRILSSSLSRALERFKSSPRKCQWGCCGSLPRSSFLYKSQPPSVPL